MAAPGTGSLRPRQRRAGLAVVVLAGLAAGCGSGAVPHSVRPTATRQATVTPAARSLDAVIPHGRWRGLRARSLPELPPTAHLAARPWKLLGITGGGKVLLLAVTFACGLPPVGVHLTQSPSAVTVTIYAHHLPADFACSGAIGTALVAVKLAAPLAGRKLMSHPVAANSANQP